MKVTIIGAAGKNAPGAIRDLADSPEVSKVVLADLKRNADVLRERAVDWGNGKAEIAFIDFKELDTLRKAIQGSMVVGNCSIFTFNLDVMEACLIEGAHYVDMGGFFHGSRKQLAPAISARWKEKGLTAIVGMGSAPGITNVLARYGADLLDTVESIHLRDGIVNFAIAHLVLPVPYALETLIDEFYAPGYIFEGGDWREVAPLFGGELIDFPAPVGPQTVYCTLHTEVATVPLSFLSKGIKNMSFKLALPKILEDKLRFLVAMGLGSKNPIQVGGKAVAPRDVLYELVDRLPKPQPIKPDDHKALRADVKGTKDGRQMEIQVDAMCHPYEPWGMATGPHSVGGPVGITCRLIGKGIITKRGSLPAEACIPPQPFFEELNKRGISTSVTIKYSPLQSVR